MITYENTKLNVPNDGASQVIREVNDYFTSNRNISTLGRSYFDNILSDNVLFEEYTNAISEGIEADHRPLFEQLLNNSRVDTMLSEEGSIGAIASLQGSLLRKFFPRLVLKDSMPMEVAEKPNFWIRYSIPYYVDSQGTRYQLPKYTRDAFINGQLSAGAGLLPIYSGFVSVPELDYINLFTGKDENGAAVTAGNFSSSEGGNLATLMSAAVAKAGEFDKLDADFSVAKVRVSLNNGYTANDGATHLHAADTLIDVDAHFKTDINGTVYGVIDFSLPTSGDIDSVSLGSGYTVTNPTSITSGAVAYTAAGGGFTATVSTERILATVIGRVNFQNSVLNLAVSGSSKVVAASFEGYVSSVNNNFGGGTEFDIDKREVIIGAGEHINAAIPVEYLKDLMALYNIDGHIKTVDLMSIYIAQKTEFEAWNFLKKSYITNKLGSASVGYAYQFDVFPAREYAGRPQEWLEELKRIIDYAAIKMRNDSSYPGGTFVVTGNPLDIALVKNVTWNYRSGSNVEKEGVDVNYSLGSYQGANFFNVISSENIPQGEIRIFFYPNDEEQMTYKYYAYSYNVESGYRDPKKPNVPSIMMTKRHTFEEFTPLQAVITITNNSGQLPPRS